MTALKTVVYLLRLLLGFERSFRYEYSYDGSDRHIGKLVLRGTRLVAFSGPTRAANVTELH